MQMLHLRCTLEWPSKLETKLRVLPKNFDGELTPGDVYYADFLKDWIICLPIPIEDINQYRKFIEFALNTCATSCPHGRKDRHRCWTVTGDKELDNGDVTKLTLTPSILIEYNPGKSIHGFVTNGTWKE